MIRTMRARSITLASLLVGLLLHTACSGKDSPPAATTAPPPPKTFVDTSTLTPAGDFKLLDLAGKTKTLADYRGKVVIIDFWATWCGPCKASIPHFIELSKEYQESGLEVIGISLDKTGAKALTSFAQGQGINYTILIGNDEVVSNYGGIRGIPTAFILTQDGKVFRKYVGYRERKVFESDVRALLGLGPAGTAKS